MRTIRLALLGVGLALGALAHQAIASNHDETAVGYHAEVTAPLADLSAWPAPVLEIAGTTPEFAIAGAAALCSYTAPRLDRRLSIGTMTARTWSRSGDEPLPQSAPLDEPEKPNRLL